MGAKFCCAYTQPAQSELSTMIIKTTIIPAINDRAVFFIVMPFFSGVLFRSSDQATRMLPIFLDSI
jgi:hypothetical protein